MSQSRELEPTPAPRWVQLLENLGEYIGVPMRAMCADSMMDSESRSVEREFNAFAITTRSGRAILDKHRFLVCPNNPFNIAQLLLARRKLSLHRITRKRQSRASEAKINKFINGHLAERVFLKEENARIMEVAMEMFVANITGGVAYNERCRVTLWEKIPRS
jgi:hypothetical protein